MVPFTYTWVFLVGTHNILIQIYFKYEFVCHEISELHRNPHWIIWDRANRRRTNIEIGIIRIQWLSLTWNSILTYYSKCHWNLISINFCDDIIDSVGKIKYLFYRYNKNITRLCFRISNEAINWDLINYVANYYTYTHKMYTNKITWDWLEILILNYAWKNVLRYNQTSRYTNLESRTDQQIDYL